MSSQRKSARVTEEIMRAAAQFLERESNRTALITVTGVELAEKGTRATILLSVLPPSEEVAALAFANRHAGEFRTFLSHAARMRRVPTISFSLDRGEKNRQRIEELSQR
jgi:ribosome-binding factor A